MNVGEILTTPEGKTLEFKRDLSSHGPILKTACAFANTAGGTLVFGIADDGSVVGVSDPLSQEERVASILADGISPRIMPEIEVLAWRDKNLLAVTVHPGSLRPYRVNSAPPPRDVFVRVGSTNRVADPELVAELERVSRRNSFDEELCPAADAYLDADTLARWLPASGALGTPALRSMRLLADYQGDVVPTVAGVLLAGRDRELHFPHAHVRAGKFAGSDRRTILDSREFRSGLLDMAEETLKWIDDRTLRPIEISGTRHTVRFQYPPRAVREAVINAIIHADYSQNGSPLRVALYEDRLEIENPGLLPFGLTTQEMQSGVSLVRNRTIARVFQYAGLVEQWGSGVPRMIEACREAGLPLPRFEEIGFAFRVTLFCDERGAAEVDEVDARLLEALATGDRLRTADLAERIDRTTRATRTRLQRLIERGLVVDIGSGPTDPNRTYHIAEDSAEYRVRGN